MAEDKLLEVEIVTPQKVVFSGKAIAVTVPGTVGPFQVLWNHAPIVSSLVTGKVKIINPDETETLFSTNGGFAEVRKNHISVMVESVI